jgi:hypothetical protein
LKIDMQGTVVDHPHEESNIRTEACGKKTSYGLGNVDCFKLKIVLEDMNLELYSPPQVYDEDRREDPTDEDSTPQEGIANQAGYNIIVGRDSSGVLITFQR